MPGTRPPTGDEYGSGSPKAGHAAFDRQIVAEEEGELALLAALTPAERLTLADLLRTLVVAAEAEGAARAERVQVGRGVTWTLGAFLATRPRPGSWSVR